MELQDICSYIDFLITNQRLFVTLHGEFVTVPELIRYNFHLNPYCAYIKNVMGNLDVCIKKQHSVIEKCRAGAFFGVCYAGVGEYVYPVTCGGQVVGFISVSGYVGRDEKTAQSKARHFAEKNHVPCDALLKMRSDALSAAIPEKAALDAVIRPLQFMLEQYLEREAAINKDSGDFYAEIVRYITAHHTARITMEDLAKRFHCSVSMLSHLFKKCAGVSISVYIENLRLDEAAWFLRQSSYSVTEISDSLGFCNPAYFSSVFKKKYGVTPKVFARENR